jgi:hypothetical protein
MFLSAPYWNCPKCGEESFGVVQILHQSYKRRCKDCHYPDGTNDKCIYQLPLLKKKIIYIDQFAISNMMKAVNGRQGHAKAGVQNEFWLKMFDKLYKLCCLQLVVCPESGFHSEESSLCCYFAELKKMYELLSFGVKFKSDDDIKELQICEHARYWLAGKPKERIETDRQSVMDGKIDAWQERFTISIDWKSTDEIIDGLRKARKAESQRLGETVKRWQQEKEKSFDDWFEEESSGYGKAVLKMWFRSVQGLMDVYKGEREATLDDILIPFSLPYSLVQSLSYVFANSGVGQGEVCSKVVEYLRSDSLKNVPFVEISSLLFAALARKYAAGMCKPPDEGLKTDINIVSVLLPYCDAMFIDNQMCNYLEENPVCERLSYGTKIFSLNYKSDFMKYLELIAQDASKEHLEKVKEVYGEESIRGL